MESKECKYCDKLLIDIEEEGLKCMKCAFPIHIKCLQRGSVPGGLHGDVFYEFTCKECSETNLETFSRDKMPWYVNFF